LLDLVVLSIRVRKRRVSRLVVSSIRVRNKKLSEIAGLLREAVILLVVWCYLLRYRGAGLLRDTIEFLGV
jgi:hypothetical protein